MNASRWSLDAMTLIDMSQADWDAFVAREARTVRLNAGIDMISESSDESTYVGALDSTGISCRDSYHSTPWNQAA